MDGISDGDKFGSLNGAGEISSVGTVVGFTKETDGFDERTFVG